MPAFGLKYNDIFGLKTGGFPYFNLKYLFFITLKPIFATDKIASTVVDDLINSEVGSVLRQPLFLVRSVALALCQCSKSLVIAVLQRFKSLAVSCGCLRMPPRSTVFITLKPLHFRISFSAFAVPRLCLKMMLNGKIVLQTVTITALFPLCRGCGMPLSLSPIKPYTMRSKSIFSCPGMLPQ